MGAGRNCEGRTATALAASMTLLISILALTICSAAATASHPPEYEFLRGFGPDGGESTGFIAAASTAIDQQDDVLYVLDSGASKLYKFDSDGSPLAFGGTAPYITGNEINGLVLGPFAARNQVAVDSTSHEFYVTDANTVRAFQANGEPANFSAGPGAGSNRIEGFGDLTGLAVDVNGTIYASDGETSVVKIFAASGEELGEFAVPPDDGENAAHLAVDSTGAVYVNRRVRTVLKFTPSSFPVTAGTTYTAADQPLDPVSSYTVAVDPATDDVYVSHVTTSEPKIRRYNKDGVLLATFAAAGEEGGDIGISEGIAIDGGTATVFVATQPTSSVSQVRIFRLKPPPPPMAPTVADLAVSNVSDTSATLLARINPNSVATSYRFEYGLEDCSLAACTSVPLNPEDIGADHELVAVSEDIAGLQPGSVYHYRVIAENAIDVTESEVRTFTTHGNGPDFVLIDRRVWEMVTPSDKHGALVLPGLGGGQVQAAADGDGLAYLTQGSIESEPAGSRSESASVLARRGDGGWRSKDLMPPNSRVGQVAAGQQSEYKLFDADLSEALLDPRDGTNLSPEASERTPYWRQNSEPPQYRPLVTGKEGFANVPPGTVFGGEGATSSVDIQASTPDLDHVVLRSPVPLVAGAPSTPEFGVYKWAAGKLEAVSVLPDGESGAIASGTPGSGGISVRHAISDDGSRVFWSAEASGDVNALYVRDTEADESGRLDVKRPDASGLGTARPVFQGANADGTVVFFTDSRQLTKGASPSGSDLYRCELPPGSIASGCATLTNLSLPTESGESAEVQGVVSALSDDGTKVYFVAKGDIGGGANQEGHSAIAGEPNLYVWRQGDGIRFIATLSDRDGADWGQPVEGSSTSSVAGLSAASSPSGRYFAFMSERSLTGEANLGPTWEAVERVFRYDLSTDRLDCISCNPTGASPEGETMNSLASEFVDPRSQWPSRLVAAVLPQPTAVFEGALANLSIYRSRVVHDNGRVFFNAIDSLVPADSNGEWDVYQYEPNGSGTCSASSGDAATLPSAAGCVSLISSGTAEEPAGFLDAGVGGDDAFFITSARLSVTDKDKQPDIYDARVDGVAATLQPSAECLGEACQPAANAPQDPTPASAALRGAGNLAVRQNCGAISRRAGKLTRRAKALHRKAERANGPEAAEQLRRKAERHARKARGLSERATRCRHANRRAAR